MLNCVRCGIKRSSTNLKTVAPFSWRTERKPWNMAGWSASRPILEPDTSRLQFRSVTDVLLCAFLYSVFASACFTFFTYESAFVTSELYVRNAHCLQASFHFICTHVLHKHTSNCCFKCLDCLLRIEYIDLNTLYNNTLKIFQLHF